MCNNLLQQILHSVRQLAPASLSVSARSWPSAWRPARLQTPRKNLMNLPAPYIQEDVVKDAKKPAIGMRPDLGHARCTATGPLGNTEKPTKAQ